MEYFVLATNLWVFELIAFCIGYSHALSTQNCSNTTFSIEKVWLDKIIDYLHPLHLDLGH